MNKNKKDKNNKNTQKILYTQSKDTLLNKLLHTPYQKTLKDEDIERIMGDLVVSQNNISRKAFVEKKEVLITTSNATYQKILKSVFHASILSQILETYLYGINVFEVNWEFQKGLYIPKLIGRDYREFKLNDEGKLVFLGNGFEEEIPSYKVVYGIYNQSFRTPYGESALRKLYFSVNIKNAGLDFWIQFLERFGSPWAIAKTDEDAQSLAYEVSKMLNGATAVIDKEEEIALIQPSNNAALFKEIAEYCDSQINRFMLGANLTGEVSSGSLAAAQIHNEIRGDIALSDERILCYVCNRVIEYFKALNGITEEITFKLFDECEPKIELASRDKTIYEMGYQPTQEYIEKTYNLKVTPIAKQTNAIQAKEPNLKEQDSNKIPNALNVLNSLNPSLIPFKQGLKTKESNQDSSKDSKGSNASNLPLDELDKGFKSVKLDSKINLEAFLKDATSFEEVEKKIQKAFKGEELSLAEEELAKLIANANILGAWSVFDEL